MNKNNKKLLKKKNRLQKIIKLKMTNCLKKYKR